MASNKPNYQHARNHHVYQSSEYKLKGPNWYVGWEVGRKKKKRLAFLRILKICVKKKKKKQYISSQFFFAMYFKVFLFYFWKHKGK